MENLSNIIELLENNPLFALYELFKLVGSGLLVFLLGFLLEYKRRYNKKRNLRIALCSELIKCDILLSCSLELPPHKIYSNFNIEKLEKIYQELIPFISEKRCQQIADILDDLRYLHNEDLTEFIDIIPQTIDKIEALYKRLKTRNMPDIKNYKAEDKIERLIKKAYRN